MPEYLVSNCRSGVTSGAAITKRQLVENDANWLRLPYELWLSVLVDYGVTAADLVRLEYCTRWFSNGWGGE